MNRYEMGVVLAAATLAQPVAAQQAGSSREQLFGARAEVIDVKRSPSGRQIALITPDGEHGEVVLTGSLDSDTIDWKACCGTIGNLPIYDSATGRGNNT